MLRFVWPRVKRTTQVTVIQAFSIGVQQTGGGFGQLGNQPLRMMRAVTSAPLTQLGHFSLRRIRDDLTVIFEGLQAQQTVVVIRPLGRRQPEPLLVRVKVRRCI